MKIRLTVILFFLLAAGMVLINIVFMFLWKHDLLETELEKAHTVLALVVPQAASGVENKDIAAMFQKTFPQDSRGGVVLQQRGQQALFPAHFSLSSPLIQFLSGNRAPAREVVRVNGVFAGGAVNARQAMFVVRGFQDANGDQVSAALALSLVPLYGKLWKVEKTVLVYIVINLLLLTVIGFYRFTQVAVKPIDRLVSLADQYQDDEQLMFVADNSGNEYSRLATSLNAMLGRIKQDRLVLQDHVDQLDRANRMLKKNQQEMIRTEKLASVGRMAAGLAHEIGNPLGVIQGYLGLLGQEKSSVSDEERDYIKRAEDELLRVNSLIRQMLDFARVSKGEPGNFSLHDLLSSVVGMVQVQPAFKSIQIHCLFEAQEDTVFADQDQLRQVFVNCLINSADAVSASSRKDNGKVTVSTRLATGRNIHVRISDNGTGIAAKDQPVVFDPFFTTKEPGKGTGLGLSVSYAIIKGVKGSMTIDNNEPEGAVVEICLPLAGCGVIEEAV